MDPWSTPRPSVEPEKSDAGQEDNTKDDALSSSVQSLGNPIQLGLGPPEILSYEYEDEEQEILRVIHRVLATGLIKNRVVEYYPDSYASSLQKSKKTAIVRGLDGPGDGRSNKWDGADDEDTTKKSQTKTRDRFVAQLEARQDFGTAGSCFRHISRPIAKKDAKELRQTREIAMRNMCNAPMIQFVRQVIYNEADKSTTLNNTFERRKQRLLKSLPGRKLNKWRHGSLAKRILGFSGVSDMSGITFNEAGHIETTSSVKAKGALKKLAKSSNKKKHRLNLKIAENTFLNMDENDASGSGTFQSLRSLTRSKKRTRVLAEDHITFLRRTMVPGMRIRARDRQMDWLTAIIRDVKNSRVLVHYEGFQEFFNEWIDINSERLRYDPSLEQNGSTQGDQGPSQSVAPEGKSDKGPVATPLADFKLDSASGGCEALDTIAISDVALSDEGVAEVHCLQCEVKISQFRIYCTYCEVESKSLGSDHKPFNLCLWCFSNAFPENHDHPRNSFATKVIVGPRGVRPVKGGIITRFEKDLLDMDYKEPDRPRQEVLQEAQLHAMMSLENDQGFMYLDQWKDRKMATTKPLAATDVHMFLASIPGRPASSAAMTTSTHLTYCFSQHEIDHEHGKEDFKSTSLELIHKEQLEKEAAQSAEQDEPLSTKKKTSMSYKSKLRSLSRLVCSYCWSATSAKWRKGYNGVLMCEDCFLAGPINDIPMQPPMGVDELPGTPSSDQLASALPASAAVSDGNDRSVGRYATSAEDYSHSPYLTRTAVSAVRFDHSSSQAVYLDSYGPAENQLYSLPIDTTYYDIPGRAPRCRCCTAVDINPAAITLSIRNCSFAIPPDGSIRAEHRPTILQGDSRRLTGPLFESDSFDHVLSHPPYKDCVAYSTHIDGDLSRFGNAAEFQREMRSVVQETYRLLKTGRRCTLGIGDNREHCFYIPVSYQLIRQYINEGFELEELIVKRQRYCAMFGLGTYLCVQFDFLCFTHEFVATLRKVPKESIDTMILEPDFTMLEKVQISSTLRSIPSCPIERKSVVMGSVWTFKPTEEYDFPTLCVSRMVERFGKNDANWEEFKLDFKCEKSEGAMKKRTEHTVEALPPEEEELVSYERDRLQQIQENNRMLLALGLITDLSETSDDIGHQNKIAQDMPCFPPPAQTSLKMVAHIPCTVLKSHQVAAYRTTIMHLAIEALQQLPTAGVFIVGAQDLRTETGKLIPLGMLILEDIIRVVGEDCLRLKELVEAVPEGYQKDRRKITGWEEFKEEDCTPNDEMPSTHLPIVHACYLVFTKVKEKEDLPN
ncbi:hypothetical protein BGX28_004364 [Mortierella sp. GBA30]|nr:hypothetical protein BGX28_004364 [Mortierella sp. GBA30]